MSATPYRRPEWWQEFFSADYLRIFGDEFTEDRGADEAEAALELLGGPEALTPGALLMDLACGQGRHAVPLAAGGHRVVGVDRSAVLLDHGRRAAASAQVEVGWVQGDLRALPFAAGGFDAVVHLWNSFGYFDDAGNQRTLDEVARCLRPGGVVLQEVANRDALVHSFSPADVWRTDDGLLVVEEHHLDLRAGREEIRYTLVEGDHHRELRTSVRLYTVPELGRMYDRAGLTLETISAGLEGGEPGLDDPLLALRGRRA